MDRQGRVSHLTDALHEMQHTATAYTSKAALGTLLVCPFVRSKTSVVPGRSQMTFDLVRPAQVRTLSWSADR